MAIIFFVAFISLGTQELGLIGSQGILPASHFLEATAAHFDWARFYLFPSFFWWNCQDQTLQVSCWLGAGLSLLLFFNIAPALICTLLTLLYLSLITVGQDFLSFQWDSLLVEASTLAIFVCPWKWRARFFDFPIVSSFGVFLLRWLLFRFVLLCGLVKILSGDPTWWHLTSLNFHFETQPLPSPLAPWLHSLPEWVHKTFCASVLIIEIAVPCFVFGSAAWRRTSFVLLVGLQLFILISGNHAFFNWLTLVLCLPLLDDSLFAHWSPDSLGVSLSREVLIVRPRIANLVVLYGLGSLLWVTSFIVTLQSTLHRPKSLEWYNPLTTLASQWRVVNSYGVFAVMTTSRQEIIIEGSADGQTWLPYELPYKPGDLNRPLPYIAPFQPRLDWQMWFAALSGYEQTPWFQSLLIRLLQNSEPVTALFAKNPFPKIPPLYIRAQLYDYHFTTSLEHQATGAYWKRDFVGSYSPELSLQSKPPASGG